MRLIDADAIEWHEYLAPMGNGQYEYSRVAYMDDIDAMPAIEPETEEEAYERGYTAGQMAQRKKGYWIFVHPLQDNDSGAYMCSVCNTGDWDIKPTDKYCKFCFAKMEEGEQE